MLLLAGLARLTSLTPGHTYANLVASTAASEKTNSATWFHANPIKNIDTPTYTNTNLSAPNARILGGGDRGYGDGDGDSGRDSDGDSDGDGDSDSNSCNNNNKNTCNGSLEEGECRFPCPVRQVLDGVPGHADPRHQDSHDPRQLQPLRQHVSDVRPYGQKRRL